MYAHFKKTYYGFDDYLLKIYFWKKEIKLKVVSLRAQAASWKTVEPGLGPQQANSMTIICLPVYIVSVDWIILQWLFFYFIYTLFYIWDLWASLNVPRLIPG